MTIYSSSRVSFLFSVVVAALPPTPGKAQPSPAAADDDPPPALPTLLQLLL